MSSILNELENDEAVLLMYLAEELSASDRAEVQQRLDSEPSLRASLTVLREAQITVNRALDSLDKSVALPTAVDVAARQIGRLMSQQQVKKVLTIAKPAAWSGRSLAMVGSLAAILLLAILGIWGLDQQSRGPIAGPTKTNVDATAGGDEVAMAHRQDILDQTLADQDDNVNETDSAMALALQVEDHFQDDWTADDVVPTP
jgi:hypothetical protein